MLSQAARHQNVLDRNETKRNATQRNATQRIATLSFAVWLKQAAVVLGTNTKSNGRRHGARRHERFATTRESTKDDFGDDGDDKHKGCCTF